MEEKISVILVNYNGKKYNHKCIESILSSTVKEKIEIIIVDNASSDGSLEQLREHWGSNEQVHILPMNQNYGFAKANNVGITWSLEHGFQYLLLLNNDTEISSQTIEEMVICQKETGGIIVPKILYADRPQVIWCAGGILSTVLKKPIHRGINMADNGQYDKDEGCTFANGCCMLLTESIISKVGLLDERFFLYYEDTEYSMRALERGMKIWFCSKAVVYHKVNGATKGNEKPDNVYYITRNWLMCNKMHMKIRFNLFICYFVLNRCAWILIWLMQGKFTLIRAVKEGGRDFCLNIIGQYGR